MKHNFYIIIAMLFLVSGCKKVDEFTQFEMDYDASVTIPSSSAINLPFNLFTPDIETNSESKFAVNDTRKDLVEEIVLREMDLTLTSPSGGDFGFLKSIEIYISAEGSSETRIAWNEAIPGDVGKYLELETAEADIKEYIKKDEFSLRLNTVTDELLTADHEIDVHCVFFVDAKILGQ